jgi:hypothetical protein
MDRRLLVCTAAARRAKHRLQRAISLSLIGLPLWFCLGTSMSLMAQSRDGFPRPSGNSPGRPQQGAQPLRHPPSN